MELFFVVMIVVAGKRCQRELLVVRSFFFIGSCNGCNVVFGRDSSLDLYADDDRQLPLTQEFVQKYRKAQSDRINALAEQAQQRVSAGDSTPLRVPCVFADPRFIDSSLDANERFPGSIPFGVPHEVNQKVDFFTGRPTPATFLDQWNLATTPANGPKLCTELATNMPILNLRFGADPIVFPSQYQQWVEALPKTAEHDVITGATHNPRN